MRFADKQSHIFENTLFYIINYIFYLLFLLFIYLFFKNTHKNQICSNDHSMSIKASI